MKSKLMAVLAVLFLSAGLAVAQDLTIDFQLDVATAAPGSFLTFRGPIRYMEAEKDHVDAATGASRLQSTALFQPYRVDVRGRAVMPSGLRGLLLYAVSPAALRVGNNLTATRAPNGVITVRYAHRGTAFEMSTDTNGRFILPQGSFRRRTIGLIVGPGPQVIHRDFSADGTAARIDWARVWDATIPGGREILAGNAARTGTITPDLAADDSMFFWDGSLQATLEGNILRIRGGLNAVKR